MLEIQTIEQIKKEIDSKEPILIYFSGENCSVCKVLKPKIENEVINNFSRFKLYEVKTDIYKEITSEFTVFSIPTIIVYFDSKEFKRYGRNMSVPLFIDEIKRPYNLMCE
jgi:thioredoxin 1